MTSDNRKAKCIIVDDEPIAIEVLSTLLQQFDKLEVIATCQNAVEASEVISTLPVDLVFLDMEMPEITGLELLQNLKNPPEVIITTAHRDYAVEGYEFDVIDYLLKPISLERLMRAVQKFLRMYFQTQVNYPNPWQDTAESFLHINVDRKTVKVPYSDIVFIESIKDYVKIHTSEKTFITKVQIGKLSETLPDDLFIRVHRSFILATNRVNAFNHEVIEIGEIEFPIGRSYKNAVLQRLNGDQK